MKSNTQNTLFGDTDYAVKEVNVLIMMGAIPEEFVEFDQESGIKIDHIITSFMERFPRKEMGEHWIEIVGNSIREACRLIKYDTAPAEGVRELDNGEVQVGFSDTERLSRQLKLKKSKLDSLVRWVIEQNPDIQPFIMHDPTAGCMVSSFLLKQLDKVGLRLDKFLKNLVSGKTRFDVDEYNCEDA